MQATNKNIVALELITYLGKIKTKEQATHTVNNKTTIIFDYPDSWRNFFWLGFCLWLERNEKVFHWLYLLSQKYNWKSWVKYTPIEKEFNYTTRITNHYANIYLPLPLNHIQAVIEAKTGIRDQDYLPQRLISYPLAIDYQPTQPIDDLLQILEIATIEVKQKYLLQADELQYFVNPETYKELIRAQKEKAKAIKKTWNFSNFDDQYQLKVVNLLPPNKIFLIIDR